MNLTPAEIAAKTGVIESNLIVKTMDGSTIVSLNGRGVEATFFVKMPTLVWREFCRRQLSMPPPLPKGGQP